MLCDFGQWCGDGDVVMSTSDSTRIIMLLSSLCRVHFVCLLFCVPSIISILFFIFLSLGKTLVLML